MTIAIAIEDRTDPTYPTRRNFSTLRTPQTWDAEMVSYGVRFTLFVAALSLGCDGEMEAPAGDDGGTPSDVVIEAPMLPAAPEMPAAPSPVSLLPCPSGWTARDPVRADGATACTPRVDGAPSCPAGSLLLPGAACAPIESCPATDAFAADLPGAGVVFVRSGASGGTGSRASPFGTLSSALAAAAPGATLALASGDYDLASALPAGVSLRGACASSVQITFSGAAPIQLASGTTIAGVTLLGPTATDLLELAAGASATIRASELRGPIAVNGDLTLDAVRMTNGGVTVASTGSVHGTDLHAEASPLRVVGGALTLESALIDAPMSEAISIEEGGSAALSELVLAQVRGVGIRAEGAGTTVTLTDAAILDAGADAPASTCLRAGGGASLTATRVHAQECGAYGLDASDDGTEVLLDSVLVEGIGRGRPVDATSDGLRVTEGAHLEAHGLSVEASRTVGLRFFLSTAYLEDLFVLDVTDEGPVESGVALACASSKVAIRRALVRGARTQAVIASDPAARMQLTDVTIADTRVAVRGHVGRGLVAQVGAQVGIERLLVSDALADGLFVAGSEASIAGTDLTVLRTDGATGGELVGMGLAIHVQETGSVDLSRVHVEESHGWGVVFTGEGVRGRLSDITIAHTLHHTASPEDYLGSLLGRALESQLGAEVTVDWLHVFDAHESGVAVFQGDLEIHDGTIEDTENDGATWGNGYGVMAIGPAQVRLTRMHLENNRTTGVTATENATVELHDVSVLRTREAECAEPMCMRGGIGLAAYRGSHVTAERFEVDGNLLAGVQLAFDGMMDLHEGEIRGSPIGANIQVDGYDFSRLNDRVRFSDNGTNLDATSLPVPEPATVVEGQSME